MRGRQTRVRESLAWYNVAAAGRPAIVQRSRAPLPRTALSCERLRERPTTKCEEAALGCVWRPGYTRATEVRQRIIIVLPRNGKIMTMSFITGPRYHLAPARSVSRAIEPISYRRARGGRPNDCSQRTRVNTRVTARRVPQNRAVSTVALHGSTHCAPSTVRLRRVKGVREGPAKLGTVR